MFRQAFRLDEFFLDNASINLSGSLKNKIEALSKTIRFAARQNIKSHYSLLTE